MARKTAKALSVVVLAMCGIAAVVATGWFVYAQDEQPPNRAEQQAGDGQDLAAMAVDLLIQEAQRLKEAGRHAEALPFAQEAYRKDPFGVWPAYLVGECLESQGRHQEALEYYLKVRGENQSEALYGAAVCYRRLGDTTRALQMLKVQREGGPISQYTIRGVALKAEIEGRSQAEIDQIVSREQEAAQLFRQAMQVVKETDKKNRSRLPLFDRVLNEYPETGAYYRALEKKANVLWSMGQREDMCRCYSQLRPYLEQQEPSEGRRRLLQTIDCRTAQHRCEQMNIQIIFRIARGQTVSTEDWSQLYNLWEQWRDNSELPATLEADVYRLYFLHTQGDMETLVSRGRAFLAEHCAAQADCLLNPSYKSWVAAAHLETGYGLMRLKRHSEALLHFRAIVDMSLATPPLRSDQPIVPAAYTYLCETMREMGASREEIALEVESCLSRYPGSSYVKALVELLDDLW